MKSRFIIEVMDDISDHHASVLVQEVIRAGKISPNDKYCHLTTFGKETNMIVVCYKKLKSNTHKFLLYKDKND